MSGVRTGFNWNQTNLVWSAAEVKERKPKKKDDAEKEDEEEKKEDQPPKPRPLHKTCSLFMRSIAPTISKAEIVAVSINAHVSCPPSFY